MKNRKQSNIDCIRRRVNWFEYYLQKKKKRKKKTTVTVPKNIVLDVTLRPKTKMAE